MQELTIPCCCFCTDECLAQRLAAPAAGKALSDSPRSNASIPVVLLLQEPMRPQLNSMGPPLPLWGRRKMKSTRRAPIQPCPPASLQSARPMQNAIRLTPVEEEAPVAGNSTGSNTTAPGNATAGPPASAADLTGLNDIATSIGSNAAAG